MKYYLLFISLALTAYSQEKVIGEELYKQLNSYRQSSYKPVLTTQPADEEMVKFRNVLDKLPSPKHNIPTYIWGLSKKNKDYTAEQIESIQNIISKYRELRARLHDERNYCRIRMLLNSYTYSIAKDEDKPKLEKRIKLWLKLWLNYKKDEEDVAYQFASEIWKAFTTEQQQKLLAGKMNVKSKKSPYKRNFSGENQLKKVFKVSAENRKQWQDVLNQHITEYSPLHKQFLKCRESYNKSYFYLDSAPGEYAVNRAAEMNQKLKEIYWFHAVAMNKLMSEIIVDANRDHYVSELESFLSNFYTSSYKKYYLNGAGKGLIDLASQ
ncbi:MAG: hypothetical protein NE328_16315 [Lentisphaeraceae bacterium]|nr:hypothetical protein [Lentisphaeraceae bacterium]